MGGVLAIEIRLWKTKHLHQKLMLGLSPLVTICVFCACWALLMEGAISRLVTNGLDLLSDVLKEEVMRQVERMQMELEHKLNIMVKVLAIASSTLSCFNLMALASITIKSRFTSWLMLPHLFTGSVPAIFFFLLPWLILSFTPLSPNFPSLMAASALLIALFRALLQEFDTLFNLSKLLPAQSKSGLRVWRNIVPDIETDRVFLVSRSVDN